MSKISCQGQMCGRKEQCALYVAIDRSNEVERACEEFRDDAFEAIRKIVPVGQWEGQQTLDKRGPFDGLIPKWVAL